MSNKNIQGGLVKDTTIKAMKLLIYIARLRARTKCITFYSVEGGGFIINFAYGRLEQPLRLDLRRNRRFSIEG